MLQRQFAESVNWSSS